MSQMIKFEVRGKPVPKQSFRYRRYGKSYQTNEIMAWQEAIGWSAKTVYNDEPMTCDIVVTLWFYMSRLTADLDNLSKAVLDALQGIIFKDDKQVVHLNVSKQKVKPGDYERVFVVIGEHDHV